MLFLLPLVGVAVGAVAGAAVTHAMGEQDRQKAKHYQEVANRLQDEYVTLQRKYNKLENEASAKIKDISSRDTTLISKLVQQQSKDETEKDLLRLALRLQQSLYHLMHDIDREPSTQSLQAFEAAVSNTNKVLLALNEETIQISQQYLERNWQRVCQSRSEKLIDEIKREHLLKNIAEPNQIIDRNLLVKNYYRRHSDFMGWSD